MYKFKKNKLPPIFSGYFTELDSILSYNTRQKVGSNLFVPRMLSKLGQKSLLFTGVNQLSASFFLGTSSSLCVLFSHFEGYW